MTPSERKIDVEKMTSPTTFFTELKSRNVRKTMAIYVSSAVTAVGVTKILVEVYNIPERIFPVVVTLLLSGIVSAFIFAWFHGKKNAQRFRRIEIGLHVLVIGIALFISFQVGSAPKRVYNPISEPLQSLAVLPLSNTDKSDGLQYIVDALTSELTDGLSRLSNTRVLYQSAVERFSSSSISPVEAGRALNVDGVVYGEISQRRERTFLRISLIDVRSGETILKNTFNRPRTEIQLFQHDVVEAIASRLSLPMPDQAQFRNYSTTAEAYDFYLQGKYNKKKNTSGGNQSSINDFARALEIDSTYLPALASLADAQEYHVEKGWAPDTLLLRVAAVNAMRILKIDSSEVTAFAVLGKIEDLRNNISGAEEYYDRGFRINPKHKLLLARLIELHLRRHDDPVKAKSYLIEASKLDPTDVDNLSNLGIAYVQEGESDEAIDAFHRALLLSPTEENIWRNLGYALERTGQLDSAEAAFKMAVKYGRTQPDTYLDLASLLAHRRNFAKAETVLTKGRNVIPANEQLIYARGYAYLMQGEKKKPEAKRDFQEGLALLKSRLSSHHTAANYAQLGLFNARLGNRTLAIECVEKAIRLGAYEDEGVLIDIVRTYAVLHDRKKLLECFKKLRELNRLDYDAVYISSAMDFEDYRNDPELLALVSSE